MFIDNILAGGKATAVPPPVPVSEPEVMTPVFEVVEKEKADSASYVPMPWEFFFYSLIKPFSHEKGLTKPYEVKIRTQEGIEILWRMGISKKVDSNVFIPSPRLRASDWHVFFAVLKLHSEGMQEILVADILKLLGLSDGIANFRRIRLALDRLVLFHTQRESEGKILNMPLLIAVLEDEKSKAVGKIKKIHIHRDFLELATGSRMKQRFDVITKLGSDTALSLYLWLPARACRATQESPAKIRLDHLATELGDAKMTRGVLRDRLRKHDENSIISQLNEKSIKGGVLKVKIEGDFLLAWKEEGERREGRLEKAYLRGCQRHGKSIEDGKAEFAGFIKVTKNRLSEADEIAVRKILAATSLSSGQKSFLNDSACLFRPFGRKEKSDPDTFVAIIEFVGQSAIKSTAKSKWSILSTAFCEIAETIPSRADFPAGWWKRAVLSRLEKSRKR